MASRKKLYSVKLEGTNSDGEEDYLYYDVYEPIEGVHDVLNDKNLPKNEQKWIRPTFPIFENCTKHENFEIYKREIRRMKYGVYFWNNGKLIYVTGVHYAGMVHWKLMESKTDYFIYTRTQRDIFYFMDLCVNDPKCVGGIIFSLKRLGKSEIMQLEMFVDALLSDKGRYTFQGLNFVEAKKNFAKTFYANKHLHESLPVTKFDETKKSIKNRERDNLIVFSREELTNGIIWTAVDTKTTTDNIDFGVKPSNLSGIQGQKLKRASLDEFASLEKDGEMTLESWHSKAYAQTTEDSGSVVVGKIWLIATAENITSDSLKDARQIWDDSAPNKVNLNGFTPSGLKRMFVPFYLGGRGAGFLDEFGEPKIEVAIKYWENEMASRSESAAVLYSHQNPRTIEHVFNIDKDGGLELDVIAIIEHREKELRKVVRPLYDISYYNKEVKFSIAGQEGQMTVEKYEDVMEHHKYRVGVDATSTDKNSTNKNSAGAESGKEKSKFAIVVSRITGDGQYVDVANYWIRPEKRHLAEKIALWLCMYYNKYGGCRVYPERNASAGSTLTDLFQAEGQQRLLIKQLVRHNTDRLEEKGANAYGIYIDGNNKDYRTSIMNKALRLYGHRINSHRLCLDLLKYGLKNSDLADAWGVMAMSWGNFDPETEKKEEKPKIVHQRRRMVEQNGVSVYIYENVTE
jgi:hypothetical protein